MFHQANMRTTNMDTVQVGDQTGQFSLIQIWVEAITQELGRLCVFLFIPTLAIPFFPVANEGFRTSWPILSLKHDDIAQLFLDRMTLEYEHPLHPSPSPKKTWRPGPLSLITRKANLFQSACEPQITYTFSDDATAITSVSISAIDNTCDVPIPVTFPPTAAVRVGGGNVEVEQIGNEPLVLWVTLSGAEVSFELEEPVTL